MTPASRERMLMQRYALQRHAQRQRELRGSSAESAGPQIDPRTHRLPATESREQFPSDTRGYANRNRRNAGYRFGEAEPSMTNRSSAVPFDRELRQERYSTHPEYGPADDPNVRHNRFGDPSSRFNEFPHSDFRQGRQQSEFDFSPVQPATASRPYSNARWNDPRSNVQAGPFDRPPNRFVTPAQHETPGGLPTLSADDEPAITETDSPDDRLLLPRPDESNDRSSSHRDRWNNGGSDDSYLSLKRMTYVATMIAGGRDEVGKDDFLSRLLFTVPRYPGMSVTTGFQAHFLDGPTRTDLPPRLYNLSLGFQWDRPIKQGFGLQLGLTPAFYSDFENTGSDAFRIMARVIGYYTTSPQTQWVFGFAYLDREDVRALPVFGVIHAPRDDLRFDLVFPKPRISKRFSRSANWERWGYLSGEYGGGSWAVTRLGGVDDIATYSDWKLIFGFEQRYPNGRSLLLETGYIFNREIEYRDGPGDYNPGETFMLRAGIVY